MNILHLACHEGFMAGSKATAAQTRAQIYLRTCFKIYVSIVHFFCISVFSNIKASGQMKMDTVNQILISKLKPRYNNLSEKKKMQLDISQSNKRIPERPQCNKQIHGAPVLALSQRTARLVAAAFLFVSQ